MFTKKNMIVIALIAIFVIGAVGLSAVEYDICVHVTGNPASAFYQIPFGGGNQSVTLTSGTNNFPVYGGFPTNFYIEAASNTTPVHTDSDSSGLLDENNVNHFYLVIDGSAKKDDGTPSSQ